MYSTTMYSIWEQVPTGKLSGHKISNKYTLIYNEKLIKTHNAQMRNNGDAETFSETSLFLYKLDTTWRCAVENKQIENGSKIQLTKSQQKDAREKKLYFKRFRNSTLCPFLLPRCSTTNLLMLKCKINLLHSLSQTGHLVPVRNEFW